MMNIELGSLSCLLEKLSRYIQHVNRAATIITIMKTRRGFNLWLISVQEQLTFILSEFFKHLKQFDCSDSISWITVLVP